MSTTLVRKSQIRPLNITRSDINTTTSGSALITKIIAGTGLTLSSSTGVNPGTGDVTIALSIASASALGGVKIGSGLTIGVDGTISVNATTWGSITGTLSNQTDLQAALNAKYNNPTGTTSQYIDGTGALRTFPTALASTFVSHPVKAGVAINIGQPVYVTTADGTNMIVGLASNASESTSSKTMGLLDATVSINGMANVVTEGLLAGLNTNGTNAGDPVWLGPNGTLLYGLANKPVAPAHLVFIGIVTRANANNGEIFVKVQNGFEMGELHDYVQNGVQDNYVISYEASTSLYKPKSIATLLGYTAANDSNVVHKTGNETIAGIKTFSDTTQSTSVSTGAFTVAGGVGITKNLYVGGDLNIAGNLTIGGTSTVVNAQNLSVSDNMIYLNNGIQTTITNIVANGSTIVYTTQETHNYSAGMVVSISGVSPSVFNLSNQTITAVGTNSFTIASAVTGSYVSGGTARAKSSANPDLGFAGGYNDGSYGHTGLFRDATDNVWKFFKGYTPEPDASPFIDTSHASFAYADLRAYNITGNSFIKDGGTSSQFLKADGSVDSSTYATTAQLHNAVTIGTANGLSLSTQVLSLGLASASANGALSSTDWTTFNNKQTALSGTGFVKIAGTTISYDNSVYQLASTAITTSNIGSQSVNYATTAGTANSVAWGNVSGLPSGSSGFVYYGAYIDQPTFANRTLTLSPSVIKSLLFGGNGIRYSVTDTTTGSYPNAGSTRVVTYELIDGTNSVYSSGNIYLGFWVNYPPADVTVRVQNTSGTWSGPYSGSEIRAGGSCTTCFAYWKIPCGGPNYIKKWEITLTPTPGYSINLQTVDIIIDNSEGIDQVPFVSRAGSSIYGRLNFIGASNVTKAYIDNNGVHAGLAIRVSDSSGIMEFQSSSGTKAGSMFMDGAIWRFKSSSSYDTLNIFANGNLGIKQTTDAGYTVDIAGTLRATGVITALGGTSTDWNTAFGWGNHAAAGYVSTSGSYANPTWLTSLAWTKITGAPAFITSYTETDTLATVTARGASTSTAVTFSGGASISTLALNGATTSAEASLFLGAHGVSEGGQLVLQKATSATYLYAAHLDNYQDQFRVLYGTNTTSAGIAMQINLATGRLQLPFYTTVSSFTGTAVGYLAFDASGNIITTASPGGGITGSGTTNYLAKFSAAGAVTSSRIQDDGTGIGLGGAPVAGYGVYLTTTVNDGSLGIDSSASINAIYLLKSGVKNFEVSYDTSGTSKIFRLLPYQSGSYFQIGNPSNAGTDYVFISEGTYGNVMIGPGLTNGLGNLSGATAATHKVQIKGATFHDSSVQATSFVKTSGTSSQFLKADGSVDSSAYITSSALTGYATQAWVTSQGYITGVTNISGYSYNLFSQDIRTLAPSSHSAYRLNFGFTSWANNNTSPYADYIHLRSYSDSSGGADNLIMFKKSGFGMRIWQQSFGSSSSYSSYVDVWTTADFTSNYVNSWNTAVSWGDHSAVGYWNVNLPDPISVHNDIVTFLGSQNYFSGNVVVSGTFTETSSIRYKENVIDLESVTDKVNKLRPVRYNKVGYTTQEIGLIAEEVSELFPEFVNYNEAGQAESLNYTRLSVILLQTVKELSDKIKKLETK